ncbi:protein adenylyltransferase SelO, mitochondrial isoform X2 [Perognathus longimembris pacificus]|nr:protein adenylyltransferase SelO, mitochondrial isoform X2 [Perognathus longimembris pacificus]
MASAGPAVGPLLAAAGARLVPFCRPLPPPAPRSVWAAAMEPVPRWLAGLRFDNRALRELPVETPPPGPEGAPSAPRRVPGACFARARPVPLQRPRLVALSGPALALLGLDAAAREAEAEAEAALFFSGNALLPGVEPAAHCYCGHQFGQFAGQLGDGAAMYLGEVCTAAGERWELQLKGAGPTPFSRQADGRKVLRSSIREFLCSEAMFHLGVPTTRAGACVTSESTVVRDVFYDGNPRYEKCAVVLRIAPTFIRFGSFEIFKPSDEHTGRAGPSVGRNDIRIQMLNYVISSFFPEIHAAHPCESSRVQRNAAFFREVTRRTARMVAEWQCVGFCHGVLNTDNMSIVGLTIDYGPFGFLDRYDPDHVCNASDNAGRYAYSKQPEVCKWNLQKLAEALEPELPLALGEAIIAEEFDAEFQKHYLQKMRRKLGLVRVEQEEDRALVARLLETMHLTGADFTNTFSVLSAFPVEPEAGLADFLTALTSQCASLEELKLAFRPQMDPRQLSMMLMLAQSNPQLFALIGTQANVTKELEHMEQQSRLEQLSPAELQSRNEDHWTAWLHEYRARLDKDKEGIGDAAAWQAERLQVMHMNNPKYVLRNYIAQKAIEAAENGDFSEVQRVLKLLETPYHREGGATEELGATSPDAASGGQCSYSSKPPLWAAELCVT